MENNRGINPVYYSSHNQAQLQSGRHHNEDVMIIDNGKILKL